MEECGGSKDSVHDASPEETVAEVCGGDDVEIGDNDSEVVKLALSSHGGPVNTESDYIAPDEEGGEVVEDVLVVVPICNK